MHSTQTEDAKKPRERYRYRTAVDAADYLRNMVLVAIVALVMGASLTFTVCNALFKTHDNRQIEIHEDEIADYEMQLDEADKQALAEVAAVMVTKNDEISGLNAYIDELEDVIADWEQRYETVGAERSVSFDQIKRLWYVFSEAPAGTTLSADVIAFSIEQCERWNVNPHLMWAIYTVESRLNPSAHNNSGATGLGQVIPSTGRSYWIDILGYRTFNVSMLYDPYVNIEITTALIGRNLGYGLYSAIDGYSGGAGQAYINELNRVLATRGLSVGDSNCHFWQ